MSCFLSSKYPWHMEEIKRKGEMRVACVCQGTMQAIARPYNQRMWCGVWFVTVSFLVCFGCCHWCMVHQNEFNLSILLSKQSLCMPNEKEMENVMLNYYLFELFRLCVLSHTFSGSGFSRGIFGQKIIFHNLTILSYPFFFFLFFLYWKYLDRVSF